MKKHLKINFVAFNQILKLEPTHFLPRFRSTTSASKMKEEISKKIEEFEKSSEMGDSFASFQLAMIYHNGKGGVEIDYKKALKYYERSKKDNHQASFCLGGKKKNIKTFLF